MKFSLSSISTRLATYFSLSTSWPTNTCLLHRLYTILTCAKHESPDGGIKGIQFEDLIWSWKMHLENQHIFHMLLLLKTFWEMIADEELLTIHFWTGNQARWRQIVSSVSDFAAGCTCWSFLSCVGVTGSGAVLLPRSEPWQLLLHAPRCLHLQHSHRVHQGRRLSCSLYFTSCFSTEKPQG